LVDPHSAEIGKYLVLMGLDDAAKGRVITAGRRADVRVDFQDTAPNLPFIPGAREKITG
jgi:hypothetical protein